MTGEAMPQHDALELQLLMVAGAEPAGGLLELRWRRPEGGMGQLFHDCHRPRAIVETIQGLGRRTDVYVGCAPRRHRHGGAEAIERVWALWADLDTREAVEACERFEPAPSILVRSGTGRHAYWPMLKPLTPPHARIALRRLAHTLGADMASAEPARILRPAGTLNHKTAPPRPVICERLELDAYNAGDVVGRLPDPPAPPRREPLPGDRRPTTDDPLLEIEPAVYVEALTGRDICNDGKVACFFHEDRTPSLHVYPTPEQGWACYGCGRGGTIIDFGAALYGIEPRGRGFHEIRERLEADLRTKATT